MMIHDARMFSNTKQLSKDQVSVTQYITTRFTWWTQIHPDLSDFIYVLKLIKDSQLLHQI